MRITFVLPGVFIAGGVRAIFECANGLTERGHQVNIVYPSALLSYSSDNFLILLRRGLKRFMQGAGKPAGVSWFSLNASLVKVPFMDSVAISWFEHMIPDADVVIASTWESAFSVAKLNPSKGRKAYFVQHYEAMELWNDQDCWDLASGKHSNGNDIIASMAQIIPENSKLLRYKKMVDASYGLPLAKFTTSAMLERMITNVFKQTSFGRVPIGNNFKMFYPDGEKANRNVILLPFRGNGWKGNSDTIKALDILRRKRSDFTVILYGPPELKEAAPTWVDFKCSPTDSELRRLYSCADIFVSPTWVEGWCSPPMEAMSCGTACVATNVGAVSEYAEHGKTAMLVEPRNPAGIAEAIELLLDDKSKRDMLAGAGRLAIQKYTWKESVDHMEAVLCQIAVA
ncbi:MAG: glycosyltransferase family 4 protein [Elusimicrobiales bacterium]